MSNLTVNHGPLLTRTIVVPPNESEKLHQIELFNGVGTTLKIDPVVATIMLA